MTTTLEILLVEDDRENLALLRQTLPSSLLGYSLVWDPCDDFDEAVRRLNLRRYDLVVTDVYRDRPGTARGAQTTDDRAKDVVAEIRSKRFCPIIAFTAASRPESIKEGPFVQFADKSVGNSDIVAKLEGILGTGIPGIARRIHDEIDRATGSYLWEFLEEQWQRLKETGLTVEATLERVVRRRAALQIGRLRDAGGSTAEITSVEGAEFYICPPITMGEFRLGEIVKKKDTDEYRVILTPHCHLVIQPEAKTPRAEFVLTVKTVAAKGLIEKQPSPGGNEQKQIEALRRWVQSPAQLGQPSGRYWFLPGFLDMPDLYCDCLQIESLSLETLQQDFDRFAVLDAPFAEGLQACFTGFYSAVGLASLTPERFKRLI